MIPPHELSTVELLRAVRRVQSDEYREALELELADRIDHDRRRPKAPVDLRDRVEAVAPADEPVTPAVRRHDAAPIRRQVQPSGPAR
jgi:hypothetical protein